MGVAIEAGRLYSLEEAGQLLGVSHWTLRRHISDTRAVRPTRLGRLVKLRSEEVERIRKEGLPALPGREQ